MARFKLSDASLKIITKGPNKGQKYLIAQTLNLNDPYAVSRTFVSFTKAVVAIWDTLLPASKGGSAAAELPVPDNLAIIMGRYMTYKPATKFHKVYLYDRPEKGQKAGDIMKIEERPVVFDTLEVFCRYFINDDGEKEWADGESPEKAGERAFKSYCIPITTSPVATSHADDEGGEGGDIPPTELKPLPEGWQYVDINGVKVPQPIA